MVDTGNDDVTRLSGEIAGHLRLTLDELGAVRENVRRLLDGVHAEGRRPSRVDLGGIRGELQACLGRPGHPMDGVGVAAAVGYLADGDYWLEWWRHDRRGGLEFVAHSLSPRSDLFYDYSARNWFSAAAASGRTEIVGPYVDVGGTNAYTVTVSVPIDTDRGFAGIAGADIAVARYERLLLSAGCAAPVVLTNADLRVIASNRAEYLPGDLVRADGAWGSLDVAADVFPAGAAWKLFSPALP